jgi:hypothetical protein
MANEDAALSCYLAEWYSPRLRDQPITDIARLLRSSLATMAGERSRPQLLYAVEVSEDAYTFGVFAAESAELVTHACQLAGLPPDRVTAAAQAPPTEATTD